jgi:uncharacterized repeat protein (TIGR04042 family)
MPELSFRLRWPDRHETRHYSPSSAIRAYFTPGASHPLPDFLARARAAMAAASDRVREVHGFPCARARATLAEIERTARQFDATADATVTILELAP